MRLQTLVGRLGLPLVLVGLATAGAGLPAYADEEDPFDPGFESDVELLVPDRVAVVDGKSKTVEVQIENYGQHKAEGLSLTFGDDPVPASVGFTPPAGCTVAGCQVGAIAPGKSKTIKFSFSPTADLSTFGESFEVVLEDSAHAARQSARITVVTTKEGVDLELAPIDDYKLKPGQSADVPIVFSNTGNKAPAGYGVVLLGDPFLEFPADYSNCFEVEEDLAVACAFDEPIKPDETVTLAGKAPIKVRVAEDTPGPADYFAGAYVVGLTEQDLDELPAGVKNERSASALGIETLDEDDEDEDLPLDPNELNDWDNARDFTVSVSSHPADAAALGATFEGAVGDSRTVKVGYRNNGPASTPSLLQGSLMLVDVKVPTGVEITKADPLCIPIDDAEYYCLTLENLAKGEQAEFSFTGTIKAAGSPGSITVDAGPVDPSKANNTAALNVKLKTAAGAGDGNGGGQGGTGGGDGESLPVTGAPAGFVAAGGALLLVAGGVVFFVARKRRVVTISG